MITGWTLLLGPQFVRQDFRQDLALADLLKSILCAAGKWRWASC